LEDSNGQSIINNNFIGPQEFGVKPLIIPTNPILFQFQQTNNDQWRVGEVSATNFVERISYGQNQYRRTTVCSSWKQTYSFKIHLGKFSKEVLEEFRNHKTYQI
jgi:hypothetical protein